MHASRHVMTICSLWLGAAIASGENWPQFRGPNANGAVAPTDMPTEWGPDKNIAWKVRIPGVGWSQPIVWGDKIFVTTAQTDTQARPDPTNRGAGVGGAGLLGFITGAYSPPPPKVDYQWKLLCLSADTGQVVWEQVAREGRPTIPIHSNNTYASETPVTDGERVVAYFGMQGVYCYDLDGNRLWSRDLGSHATQFGWGTGSSPVLFGDCVYIQCDNDETSFLVALDKKTGNDVWRVPREEQSNWSTPYVWRNKVRTELVTAGGNQMRSYNPLSGQLLWSLKGDGRTATTPIGYDELLFVDSYDRLTGGTGKLVAIRPGGSGDISLEPGQASNEHVAWSRLITGQRLASPLVAGHCLYILEQRGVVRCLDADSGKEHFRKRLPGASGCTASPVASGNRIYFVDEDCRTTIVEAGPELRVVAANELGEMCWSSPAIAGERLLLRTIDHLIAIGDK